MSYRPTRRVFLAHAGAAAALRARSLWAEAAKDICTVDLSALAKLDLKIAANRTTVWDTVHVLVALQALVNRDEPNLYLFYVSGQGMEVDRFWFQWMREEMGWLRERPLTALESVEAAVRRYREAVRGLVVYDPNVPATSNLASTIAGCDGLLPVRMDATPDSMFMMLHKKLAIPVTTWLVHPDGSAKFTGTGTIEDIGEKSTGSAKGDVYRWGVRRYIETAKCDPSAASYSIDSFWTKDAKGVRADMHTLTNQDWFVSRRAFFFDLSPWGDETPVDDARQPIGLDRRMLLEVFAALEKQTQGKAMIKVGGFPPWPFKYTDHAGGTHAGVPTENAFACVISQYNGYMEADAAGLGAIANASFVQHFPLPARVMQPNARPSADEWMRKGYLLANGKVAPKIYVSHYVGDYDSPSWLYQSVPRFFGDPSRGRVPLNWAFDPNLSDRAPQAMLYAYRQASANDFFVTGDSGAGYVNPRALTDRPVSGLKPGLELWAAHCATYYARWDMSVTGFVIDGACGASTDREFRAYATFSHDGVGTQDGVRVAARDGLAICREHDLPGDPQHAADKIAQMATAGGALNFLWLRSVLKSPSWYWEVTELLRTQYAKIPIETVDAFTFFGLIARAGKEGELA